MDGFWTPRDMLTFTVPFEYILLTKTRSSPEIARSHTLPLLEETGRNIPQGQNFVKIFVQKKLLCASVRI
eukprot:scaffold657_cov47-Attheya_sp.AAC.2